MGRVKLKIKKIENQKNRLVTYATRRNGLKKKAYELSLLCDIDIALVMFSLSGKLGVFCKDDEIDEVIARYANTPQPERTKQKLENVEYLQKLALKQGLEPPQIGCANLDAKNVLLQEDSYKLVAETQKARLFSCIDYIGNVINLPELATIKETLEKAGKKVLARMTQLQLQDQLHLLETLSLPMAYNS